jgi:uncharacterized Rmd1/YagE family protein
MGEGEEVTHDDVNRAFRGRQVLADTDDRLLEYLWVLCTEQIRSDENRLLANNRCATVNTILMRRFMDRQNRATTGLAWVVIILTLFSVIGSVVQVWVAVR